MWLQAKWANHKIQIWIKFTTLRLIVKIYLNDRHNKWKIVQLICMSMRMFRINFFYPMSKGSKYVDEISSNKMTKITQVFFRKLTLNHHRNRICGTIVWNFCSMQFVLQTFFSLWLCMKMRYSGDARAHFRCIRLFFFGSGSQLTTQN